MGTAPIRILPSSIAARIAAGEVISRPLSVVRELVDNAIDAGASEVVIEIARGGYDLIAAHDNGVGILAADTSLLGVRHATSKLHEDQITGVTTLGFRGEALASLLAVADVVIRTRHRDEATGTLVKARNGDASTRTSIGRQIGTSVEVTRLFSRYPVRRAAADPSREQPLIQRWVAHAALVHSEVAFTLRMDERVTLRTNGGTISSAIEEVFGDTVARRLYPIGPVVVDETTISGLIGGPSLHRARRDHVVLAVNGRLCDVPEISRAIDRVCADVLPRRRFPYACVLLQCPARSVDANIHPAKEQVALLNVELVAAALERELRKVLGRGLHEPLDSMTLALVRSELPGLRTAERAEPYGVSGEWGALTVEPGSLPRLRVVGQIDDTLIVCESDLGTLLIDQHRAHERVIFERLSSETTRHLDPPAMITLSDSLAQLARDRMHDLSVAGWTLQERSGSLWELSQLPTNFEPTDLPGILEQLTIDDRGSILAAVACHAAIRKRRPLSPDAARELLAALSRTVLPTTCPHGQPIVLRLDRRFLERQFAWR